MPAEAIAMWRLLRTGLIIMSVWVVAAPASAAPDISGIITNARPGTSVLLVGNNGSSVSARVTAGFQDETHGVSAFGR